MAELTTSNLTSWGSNMCICGARGTCCNVLPGLIGEDGVNKQTGGGFPTCSSNGSFAGNYSTTKEELFTVHWDYNWDYYNWDFNWDYNWDYNWKRGGRGGRYNFRVLPRNNNNVNQIPITLARQCK